MTANEAKIAANAFIAKLTDATEDVGKLVNELPHNAMRCADEGLKLTANVKPKTSDEFKAIAEEMHHKAVDIAALTKEIQLAQIKIRELLNEFTKKAKIESCDEAKILEDIKLFNNQLDHYCKEFTAFDKSLTALSSSAEKMSEKLSKKSRRRKKWKHRTMGFFVCGGSVVAIVIVGTVIFFVVTSSDAAAVKLLGQAKCAAKKLPEAASYIYVTVTGLGGASTAVSLAAYIYSRHKATNIRNLVEKIKPTGVQLLKFCDQSKTVLADRSALVDSIIKLRESVQLRISEGEEKDKMRMENEIMKEENEKKDKRIRELEKKLVEGRKTE